MKRYDEVLGVVNRLGTAVGGDVARVLGMSGSAACAALSRLCQRGHIQIVDRRQERTAARGVPPVTVRVFRLSAHGEKRLAWAVAHSHSKRR